MGNKTRMLWKLVMSVIFLWSAIHLARDIMQILGIHNIVTDTAARNHKWIESLLGKLYSYTSFPFEIFNLVAIPIIWGKKMNIWGWLVIISPLAVFLLWLLP